MSGIDEVALKSCPGCEKEYPTFYISIPGLEQEGILNLGEEVARRYGVVNSYTMRNTSLEYYMNRIFEIMCSSCKHRITDKTLIKSIIRRRMEELKLAV